MAADATLPDAYAAAGIATRAEASVLSVERALRIASQSTMEAIAVLAGTIKADHDAIKAMLDALGIDHEFDEDGKRFRLRLPDGEFGDWSGDLTGPVGPPPALSAGEVETLAPGETADFDFRVNPDGGYFLDLKLPKGDQGIQGEEGDAVLPDQAESTIVGRASGAGTGAPGALSASQVKTILAIALADVVGLVAALALKAPITDADLLGNPTVPTQIPSDNSTKIANTAHIKNLIASLLGAPSGIAGLDVGGLIPTSVLPMIPTNLLPALAITDIFEAADQTAMLALTAQVGDIAIRSDLNKTFALAASPASTLANWKELKSPTAGVVSVAGEVGTITKAALLAALDVEIGTDVQAQNAKLQAIAGLTAAANKIILWTGASSASVIDLSVNAQTLIGHTFAQMLADIGAEKAWVVTTKTANYSVLDHEDVWVTSGSPTITLPASPGQSNHLKIKNLGAGVVTVDRAGNNLFGLAENHTLAKGQGIDISFDTTAHWHGDGVKVA